MKRIVLWLLPLLLATGNSIYAQFRIDSVKVTNITCNPLNDGTITVYVAGGTTPYIYTLSDGKKDTVPDPFYTFSGLTNGLYWVVVEDWTLDGDFQGGLNVTRPGVLAIGTISISHVSCNGANDGKISDAASGGTSPFTYVLKDNGSTISTIVSATSATFTGLAPGTLYTIEVNDKNSCGPVTSSNQTIIEPTVISITNAITHISCNGQNNGRIDITPSGGTSPYTYLWSNSATTQDLVNLSIPGAPTSQLFSVTVTDSKGCKMTDAYTLTEPLLLTATIAVDTQLRCFDDSSATLIANVSGGTTVYTYRWVRASSVVGTSQRLDNQPRQLYQLTVTDSKGCVAIDNIFYLPGFPEYAGPSSAIIISSAITHVSCNAGADGAIDLTLSGGGTAYTYAWSSGQVTQDLAAIAAGVYTVTVTDNYGCKPDSSYTVTQPSAITITQTGITHVACNGGVTGAIDITVSGGTTAYSFAWSTGAVSEDINSLTAGNYSVTVTDSKGCINTGAFTITEAAALTVSAATTHVDCSGNSTGRINVSVAGGTPAYSFIWNDAVTNQDRNNIPAGLYLITVTDSKSCTSLQNWTITQPSALTITPAITNVYCNGTATGAINITVTGGTTGYTYFWSGGITTQNRSSLIAATYNLTVTDSKGCTATGAYTLTQPAVLTISASSVTHVLCNGGATGAIDITVTGGTTAYSFLWTGGAVTEDRTNLTNGVHSVTVTDSKGCSTTGTYTLTAPSALSITSALLSHLICRTDNSGAIDITVAGGTTSYTYLWSNGRTTEDLVNTSASSIAHYWVTVTDAKGCTVRNSARYVLTQPAAWAVGATTTHVRCFGNSTGAINLTVTGATTPYTYIWTNSATTQDLANIPAGVYRATITDVRGCTRVSASYTISQPASALTISPYSITHSKCYADDGVISITASGGTTPYSYFWSTGEVTTTITKPAGPYTITVTDGNSCTFINTYTITQPAAALQVVGSAITNVNCNGDVTGSVSVVVTGGTTAYSYVWTGGGTTNPVTNKAAGAYSVTVTDAKGCSFISGPYIITQPVAISILSASITHAQCFGDNGTIAVTVAGGTPGYTYNWTGGGTTTTVTKAPGSYTLTVTDARSCTSITGPYTITQPTSVLTITGSSITHAQCFGSPGQIQVSVSGGTPSYTYAWTGGGSVNPVSKNAGSYSVTVTDSRGCQTTGGPYVITQPAAALTITAASVTNVQCFGGNGAIRLTVTGGTTSYSYLWSAGGSVNPITYPAGTYSVTVTDAKGCTTARSGITITEPAVLTITGSSITNAPCFGDNGSLQVTVTGGTPAYSYLWTGGGVTNPITKAPGTYSVTVTDSRGCSTVAGPYTITQPAAALTIISSTITHAQCFGNNGSILLNVSGGTTGYTYSWTGGGSTNPINKAAGAYSVTVTDARGCTTTGGPYTITQPAAALTITTASITSVVCNGGNGSISVTVTGGTTAYSYSWSGGGLTNPVSKTAGSYTVTVTDAKGCTVTGGPYTITEPLLLAITGSSVTNAQCFGDNGAIQITVTGGTTNYSYLWTSGGVTNPVIKAPGSYSVTVTDARGCTITGGPYTITQPASGVSITASAITHAKCNGDNGTISLVVNGGTPAYSYLWTGGGSTNPLNITAGSYSVTVTDSRGCSSTGGPYTVTEPAAVLTIAASSITNAICNGGTGAIAVTVTGGTTAYSYLWTSGGITNPVTKTAGSYSVTVTDAKGCTFVGGPYLVTEPLTLAIISSSVTHVPCAGGNGNISVTVTGGTTAYSYAWTGGEVVNPVTKTPGSYFITVTDARGCSIVGGPYTVTSPSALTITVTGVTHSCQGLNNGAIDITTAGGSPVYLFTWSNAAVTEDISGLPDATYTLTVTDSKGCKAQTAVIVSLITAPTADAGVASDSLCSSVSYPLSAATAANYSSLLWTTSGDGSFDNATNMNPIYTPGAADLAGGSVWLWFTATGNTPCGIAQDSIQIVFVKSPSVDAGTGNTICNGDSYYIADADTNFTQRFVWRTSGDGTFNDSLRIDPTYVPGVFDNLGGNTIQLYLYGFGYFGCDTVVDSVAVIIPQKLEASIGAPSPFNIGPNTKINVSFTITGHGFIEDMGFYLVAPDGLTTLTLKNSPYSLGSVPGSCYTPAFGGNANNLTFSNSEAASDTLRCGEPTPLTGVYNITDNWSTIYGFAAAEGGWKLMVTDCFKAAGTTGQLTAATITFTDTVSLDTTLGKIGDTITITFTSGVIAEPILEDPAGLVCYPTFFQTPMGLRTRCFGSCDAPAMVNVVGGVTPYTYTWSGPFPPQARVDLCAGVHTVTITDGINCSTTTSVTVTEPPEIKYTTLTFTDSLVCNGDANGTITMAGTGGTGALVYSINNGLSYQVSGNFTGLTAGTYLLSIKDDNGCRKDTSITINQPAPITVTALLTHNTCSGSDGAIDITVNGGTIPYTFNWNDGNTVEDRLALTDGSYTVSVTDSKSCKSAPATFVISSPSSIVIDSVVYDTMVSCTSPFTDITIYAHGGTPPLEYSIESPQNWVGSNVFASQPVGFYYIAVRDLAGCIRTGDTIEVKTPSTIIFDSVVVDDISCNGLNDGKISVWAHGGSGLIRYILNDGTSDIDSNATGLFNSLIAGVYEVRIKDVTTLCDTTITGLTIIEPAVLTATITTQNISCHNANDGRIIITGLSGGTAPYRLYLYNPVVLTDSIIHPAGDTAFRNLMANPAYRVEIYDTNGCSFVRSFIEIVNPPHLHIDSVVTDTNLCSSAYTLNVYATGGSGALEYSFDNGVAWQSSNTLNGIIAGTFTILVRDTALCPADNNGIVKTLDSIGGLIFVIDSATVNRNECGEIIVYVTGGVTPFSYSLVHNITDTIGPQPGKDFTGLTPDTYEAIVRDSRGCVINFPGIVIPQIVIDSMPSHGDTLVIYAHGGVGDLDYYIDTIKVFGATAPYKEDSLFTKINRNKLYYVYVRDSQGCWIMDSVTFDLLNVRIDSIMATKCPENDASGGFYEIVVSGGVPPYTGVIRGIGRYSARVDTIKIEYNIFLNKYVNIDFRGNMVHDTVEIFIWDDSGRSRTLSNVIIPSLTPHLSIDTIIISSANCQRILQGHKDIGKITVIIPALSASMTWSDGGDFTPYYDTVIDRYVIIRDSITSGNYSFMLQDVNKCTTITQIVVVPYTDTVSVDVAPGENDTVFICEGGFGTLHSFPSLSLRPITNRYTWTVNGSTYTNYDPAKPDIVTVSPAAETQYFIAKGWNANYCYDDQLFYVIRSPRLDILDEPTIDNIILLSSAGRDINTQVIDNFEAKYDKVENDVIIVNEDKSKSPIKFKWSAYITDALGEYTDEKSSTYISLLEEEDTKFIATSLELNKQVKVKLYAVNSLGCSDTVSFLVKLWDGFIPSGFTPNGDGVNDYWEFYLGMDKYITVVVEVFNRWGEKVYMNTGYEDDGTRWDGRRNGKDLPIGTYYYIITVKDKLEEKQITGPVTILR